MSSSCPACTGEGRLHSCPDFPLPDWAPAYLETFDRFLQSAPVPLALAGTDPAALLDSLSGQSHEADPVTVTVPVLAPAHGSVRDSQIRLVTDRATAHVWYSDRDWNAEPVSGTLAPVAPAPAPVAPMIVRHVPPAPAGTYPGQSERQRRRNERRKQEAAAAFLADTTKRQLAALTESATLPPIPFDQRDVQDWTAA